MRTIFVVVNGKPRAGKDSFAEFCVKYLTELGQSGEVYSTITTCVKMAHIAGYKTYYDEDVPKTPENRAMLSDLKDWYTKWFDGTFNEMIRLIDVSEIRFPADGLHAIFAMIREPEEIEKIKNYCSLNDIFFTSIIGEGLRSEAGESCHSDRNVNNFQYEHSYINDGTLEELDEKAKLFTRTIVADLIKFEKEKPSINLSLKIE